MTILKSPEDEFEPMVMTEEGRQVMKQMKLLTEMRQRIRELQALAKLTPGEYAELRILILKRWKG